jgi:hypothetical protein
MSGVTLNTTVSVIAECALVTNGEIGASWPMFQTRLPVAPGMGVGAAVTAAAGSLLRNF